MKIDHFQEMQPEIFNSMLGKTVIKAGMENDVLVLIFEDGTSLHFTTDATWWEAFLRYPDGTQDIAGGMLHE